MSCVQALGCNSASTSDQGEQAASSPSQPVGGQHDFASGNGGKKSDALDGSPGLMELQQAALKYEGLIQPLLEAAGTERMSLPYVSAALQDSLVRQASTLIDRWHLSTSAHAAFTSCMAPGCDSQHSAAPVPVQV